MPSIFQMWKIIQQQSASSKWTIVILWQLGQGPVNFLCYPKRLMLYKSTIVASSLGGLFFISSNGRKGGVTVSNSSLFHLLNILNESNIKRIMHLFSLDRTYSSQLVHILYVYFGNKHGFLSTIVGSYGSWPLWGILNTIHPS